MDLSKSCHNHVPAKQKQELTATLATNRQLSLILVVALVGLSFSVRLYNLGGQGLECEEFYTIPAATGHHYLFFTSPPESRPSYVPVSLREYKQLTTPETEKGLKEVTSVLSRNVHMPLYFYLMHFWIKLAGTSESALRLPSVVFGALAVLVIFLLGKDLFNPMTGFTSAILTAFMPDQIYFSQEARMYALLILLATSSVYAIILTKKHAASCWPYVFNFTATAAGLYTHYVYVFCFAFQLLYIWLASSFGRERPRAWLVTHVSVIVAFLPWAFVALTQKQTSSQVIAWAHGTPPSGSVLYEIALRSASLIAVPEVHLGWLSVIAAYTLLILGVISLRSRRQILYLLCLWVVTPLLGIVLMDALLETHGISIPRYWMIMTPALYLLIAVGIIRIAGTHYQIPVVGALGILLLLSAVHTATGHLRSKYDEHQQLGQYVDQQVQNVENGFVMTEGSNAIPLLLGYYCEQPMPIMQFAWAMDKQRQPEYRKLIQNSRNAILITSGKSNAFNMLEKNQFFLTAKPARFGHMVVYRFTKSKI